MTTEAEGGKGTAASLLILAAVLVFFTVSGACGLLYQVVWTRKLVLLFGTTSYAVSTVLSVFFLGLGLGSLWGGRLADRRPRPLQRYGFFEIIIGLWALAFLFSLNYGEGLLVIVLRYAGLARGAGIALRALMAGLLLFVPVALMGATLPLLAKFVNREARVRGLKIGALYTLNTLGAVAGCFATGFFLIARFGYTRTTLIGATANVVVGLLAILLSRAAETAKAPVENATAPAQADQEAPHNPAVATAVLAAFGVVGFCGLALEVLWTRLLTIVFLGTTYAYTTMLTALLCGIALGSAVASVLVDRLRGHVALLGGVLMISGASCVIMLRWIAGMPQHISQLHGDWESVIAGKFILAFLALFLPAFCSGMAFPIVVKVVAGARSRLGRHIGLLYSVNTFGGVLGAIAGGFLLLPLLGTHWGITVLALLLSVTGGLLTLLCREMGWPQRVALVIGGVLLLGVAWLRAPEDVNQALNAGYVPKSHHVIHYREGVEGTVAVTEPRGDGSGSNRWLWINRVQATISIEKGVKMNRLQGALPLLFEKDPKTVLFMCFGSGITCGTLALSDFDRIDAVEISPDVLEAAPLFKADNLGVLDRPNVHPIVDDGRNFLLTATNVYDVITFEPMPLALAGVSTFYTREYYQLCLDRLTPGGVVSQWVPLHSLNPEVVQSLVRTFAEVFPEYCAWFVNADLFLIGSNQPLYIDYARAEARLAQPELRAALAEVGFHDTAELMACFLMDRAGVDRFAAKGRIMTDDRPWAEFVAPKLVYERSVQHSIAALQPCVASPLSLVRDGSISPEERARLERRRQARVQDLAGLRHYYSGAILGSEASDAFRASLAIDPDNFNAKYYLKQIALGKAGNLIRWEQFDEAREMLDEILGYFPQDDELAALMTELQEAQSQ